MLLVFILKVSVTDNLSSNSLAYERRLIGWSGLSANKYDKDERNTEAVNQWLCLHSLTMLSYISQFVINLKTVWFDAIPCYLSGLMDVFPLLVVARKPPRWNGLWECESLSSRKFPEFVRIILYQLNQYKTKC